MLEIFWNDSALYKCSLIIIIIKNFIGLRRLSKFISSYFGAIHSGNVRQSWKFTKNAYIPPIVQGSRSFKVIDVNKSKKLVAGVWYNKQHVCICNRFHAIHETIAVK